MPQTLGEGETRFETRFVYPAGRTARGDFVLALVPLGLAAIFYHLLVRGGSGDYAMLIQLYPAIVVHARRLQDMGRPAWLLLVPAVPVAAAIWLHMYDKGQSIEGPVIWAALGVSALFTLWGLAGKAAPAPAR